MINNVVLVGRLTKNAEIRMTQSGKKCARVTVAVDRGKKNGESLGADFVSCVAWERTADLLEAYTRKGSLIGLMGRIQTGSYDDPNYTGRKVFTTDVVISTINLLESKPKEEKPQEEFETEFVQTNGTLDIDEDDLPF